MLWQELLGDFINGSEWPGIIAECDPDFIPPDGIVGLRPIHVFGLANVLRRPILLLDSVAGMNTSADYAGWLCLCFLFVDKYIYYCLDMIVHCEF